jgi:hypothetical protein
MVPATAQDRNIATQHAVGGERRSKTGVVNIPGVQQQYGKNFGNSVIPYRPSSPVFSAPLGPRR